MNLSSKSNDKQKPAPPEPHDACSGWGIILGIIAGIVIGLFFDKAIILGCVLGSTGWVVGAFIDRARH